MIPVVVLDSANSKYSLARTIEIRPTFEAFKSRARSFINFSIEDFDEYETSGGNQF